MFLAPTLEKPDGNKGFGPLRPRPQGQGCASWAQNSKGPQTIPFWHQSGRHPTILDILGGPGCRTSARSLPDRTHPLNLNYFSTIV